MEDYRALCKSNGLPDARQADFESAITTLVGQANGTTLTQQLMSAYAGLAMQFGMGEGVIPAFLNGHTALGEKYGEEIKSAAGAEVESYSERSPGVVLATAVPAIAVAVIIGATFYLAVDKWYGGGWSQFTSDMKKYMQR